MPKQYPILIGKNLVQAVPDATRDKRDERFSFFIRDPGYELDDYLNYIDAVNVLFQIVDRTQIAHPYMLGLGYIPLVMPPSFWPRSAIDNLISYIPTALPRRAEPSYFMMGRKTYNAVFDLWASKLDLERIVGIAPEHITTRKVYERFRCLHANT